jgi:ADP-heptose:LPS heptosyltransferase
VNCKEFQRPIYEAIGCKTMCIREPFGLSWAQEHGNDYGRIVSLATWDQWQQWQYGENTTSTMEAFAQILGVELPEEFSWIETLNAESKVVTEYILFAPNSTERWRSLPASVADSIESELEQFGKVVRLKGDECKSWEELRDLIHNASYVVTVESGISNVAGALGKKMVVLIGMTEVETTVEQYRKYIPDLEYKTVKGFQPQGCSMPCMRRNDRGFINDKCLGKNDLPECLSKLDVSKVIEEFSKLMRG